MLDPIVRHLGGAAWCAAQFAFYVVAAVAFVEAFTVPASAVFSAVREGKLKVDAPGSCPEFWGVALGLFVGGYFGQVAQWGRLAMQAAFESPGCGSAGGAEWGMCVGAVLGVVAGWFAAPALGSLAFAAAAGGLTGLVFYWVHHDANW